MPELPDISPTLRVWGSSSGLAPASLVPGSDVVLDAPRGHGDLLPHGVLLDDWLSPAQRLELDREARRRAATWLERHADPLTLRGVCVAAVHELQLHADVFLRETRVVEGLRALVRSSAPERVELRAVDRELAGCLERVLDATEVDATRARAVAPPEYPLAFRGRGTRTPGITALREATGLPGITRGGVLIEPYWHLTPLWGPLGRERGTTPVLNPVNPPALAGAQLARIAARGGWISSPGLAARRRSRRELGAALAALASEPARAADPLDALLAARAPRLLAAVGAETLAEMDVRRRAFGGGGLRAALGYSDTAPVPRLNALAAHEQGRAVVQVQHGSLAYVPREDGRPARILDGWLSDLVAVWSRRDAKIFAPHLPGRVDVTGNPGAAGLLGRAPVARPGPSRTLVLGQMPGPLSATADIRVTAAHLRAALTALSGARPGSRVLVRPHPLDTERDTYRRIAGEHAGVEVRVDAGGSVEEAIASADLCVGALSTATLQAAAMGRPTVLLDVTGIELTWPFDASGDFPTAHTAAELAERLAAPADGREVALEALGASAGAVERVTELVREAVR